MSETTRAVVAPKMTWCRGFNRLWLQHGSTLTYPGIEVEVDWDSEKPCWWCHGVMWQVRMVGEERKSPVWACEHILDHV